MAVGRPVALFSTGSVWNFMLSPPPTTDTAPYVDVFLCMAERYSSLLCLLRSCPGSVPEADEASLISARRAWRPSSSRPAKRRILSPRRASGTAGRPWPLFTRASLRASPSVVLGAPRRAAEADGVVCPAARTAAAQQASRRFILRRVLHEFKFNSPVSSSGDRLPFYSVCRSTSSYGPESLA